MAVFFEGLQHHVWITTLKLGVRGRSWNHCVEMLDGCFFLKNPVSFFWNLNANATVTVDRQSNFNASLKPRKRKTEHIHMLGAKTYRMLSQLSPVKFF